MWYWGIIQFNLIQFSRLTVLHVRIAILVQGHMVLEHKHIFIYEFKAKFCNLTQKSDCSLFAIVFGEGYTVQWSDCAQE